MSCILIYVTCPDSAGAEAMVRVLLERRLVACANIMHGHQSLYRWQGEIEAAQEHAVILKTRAELFERVRDALCELHPYECPCILAIKPESVHEPFMQWINAQCDV